MSTPRPIQIMADLAARLRAAGTVAGNNVERSREMRLDDAELPIILLFAQESVAVEDAFLGNNRSYQQGLQLVVAAMLPYQDSLDDALYVVADQIRDVVLADETHGGQASQTTWGKTSWGWETENINVPHGWAVLEFTTYYRDE